jgi:acetolactate synthase-1/2/3 large subunit
VALKSEGRSAATGADLFVACLKTAGVDIVFGVPGEENADLMMALDAAGLRFVLTRHEQGAAFMAATHGRLTGRLAACLGTLGPGATNLLTGVAEANMDNIPLLVITGQAGRNRLHKQSHQVIDIAALFAPVTRWSYRIETVASIPEVVLRGVRLATLEQPGAVHLSLPEDIAAQDTDARPLTVVPTIAPAPAPSAIHASWTKIAMAERPVILAGHGVVRAGACNALRVFCEVTGIGVLSTFMAKGVLPPDHPQCLFTIGMGQKDLPACLVAEADLVIAVGYDMVEYPPESWNGAGDTTIIHIGSTAAGVDAHYVPQIEVVGHVGMSLHALADCAQDTPVFSLPEQMELRRAMQAELRPDPDHPSTGPITPQAMISTLQSVLDPADVLICGVGAHKMWVARQFPPHHPNGCLISNGFCAMGLPLPGVIAAALACPDRQIVGLAGDGDVLMNVQEMETARRMNAALTLIVWEDHGYGLIEWKQQQTFGRHTDLSFGNPDWSHLARAFDWSYHGVSGLEGLENGLRAAFAHYGASLVVLPIDYRENMKLSKRLGALTCRL